MGRACVDKGWMIPRGPVPDGMLPVTIGEATIVAMDHVGITSVAPFAQATEPVTRQLALPETGRATDAALWFQPGCWMIVGREAAALQRSLAGQAAVTDQSDGWLRLHLSGPATRDILARVCALDLRACAPGDVARTELAHQMAVIVARTDGIEIWLMRSLAEDGLKHLIDAAKSVAAQGQIDA